MCKERLGRDQPRLERAGEGMKLNKVRLDIGKDEDELVRPWETLKDEDERDAKTWLSSVEGNRITK